MNKSLRRIQGYVLLDVLLSIFLFTLGFSALYGLTEGAIQETQQAVTITEAANLAQSIIDDLAVHPWSANIAERRCVPGEVVEGSEGRFTWEVYSEWESLPSLLKVSTEVFWVEKGQRKSFKLLTLFEAD